MQPLRDYHTPEEYFLLEEQAEHKSEYYQGQIYAFAEGSFNHSQIAGNLITDLNLAFRGKPCRTFTSDLPVGVESSKFYAYPDVSVVCGPLEFVTGHEDIVTNPIILIEVLSLSTRNYDLTVKFKRYRDIPSLQAYVIVNSQNIYVEYHRKVDHNSWLSKTLTDLNDNINLDMVEVEIPLTHIYDKVEFKVGE